VFFLPFVAVGFLVGWLGGGRARHLADLPLRLAWALLLGGLLRVVSAAPWLPGEVARSLLVVALSILAVAALENRHLVGMWFMAAGALCHLSVVVANGGFMPVWWVADPSGRLYIPAQAARLAWLGDAIPAGTYNFSFGDLLLGMGLVTLIALGMQSDREGERK
jgi:hypothetical protein